MLYTVCWSVLDGARWFAGASPRYALLERLSRSAGERGVQVLAFGLADHEVRLVLRGQASDVTNVVRGVKVGTIKAQRSRGVEHDLGPSHQEAVHDLCEAVAWAHQAPLQSGASGPLASPWSSHRDLLGYRVAPFFDARPLRRLVDAQVVHELVGGRTLPVRRRPAPGQPRESLCTLLRLAAGVIGVLPADRRCFRLFVHLGQARGWPTRDLAQALQVSGRRVRQLRSDPEPHVGRALRALSDPRLCLVP